MNLKDRLFLAGQHLAPQHLLSRLAGHVADCRAPFLKDRLIARFVRRYGVEMGDALRQDPRAFDSFNDFFTRELRPGARRFDETPGGVQSPADGVVSMAGPITAGRLIQAKGHDYGVADLLGGDAARARPFEGGAFATIYLSPRDYHRVHMPVAGTLREIVHVPGQLFSVNPLTASHVPRLFARNERVVCLFETGHGPMALVLVGAMIVASVETVWTGPVMTAAPSAPPRPLSLATPAAPLRLAQGQEMGRFRLGSTVIVLFGPDRIRWADTCVPSAGVRVGELLALAA
ncbi:MULTISPECIES: archaetidylserine decarboxylase [Cupriavidus]